LVKNILHRLFYKSILNDIDFSLINFYRLICFIKAMQVKS
jgi:hypothetical protein